jgi:hypothetical protein
MRAESRAKSRTGSNSTASERCKTVTGNTTRSPLYPAVSSPRRAKATQLPGALFVPPSNKAAIGLQNQMTSVSESLQFLDRKRAVAFLRAQNILHTWCFKYGQTSAYTNPAKQVAGKHRRRDFLKAIGIVAKRQADGEEGTVGPTLQNLNDGRLRARTGLKCKPRILALRVGSGHKLPMTLRESARAVKQH